MASLGRESCYMHCNNQVTYPGKKKKKLRSIVHSSSAPSKASQTFLDYFEKLQHFSPSNLTWLEIQ